jgi:GntR family transcriptional regulator
MIIDAAPLYRGLRATLMAEIASGKFQVGSRFPTDYELCARFRVSRHTVREALRSLQDEGMLVRQPGSGTIVTARPGAPRYVHTIESLEQLYSNARTARLAIHHIRWIRLGQRLAGELERPLGERWLQVSGLRTIGEMTRPQSWVEVFVAARFGAIRDEIIGEEPIHQHLERRFDLQIAAIDMRLSAIPLAPTVAHLLRADAGSPGLLIRRRYLIEAGEPIEMSLSLQPGDQYSPTMRFRRSKSGGEAATEAAPLAGTKLINRKRGRRRPGSSRQ